MSSKYFKFHFKNDKIDKAESYDVGLNNFSEAVEYAYNKLDGLNEKNNGYRIIGVYEILTLRENHVPRSKTNY